MIKTPYALLPLIAAAFLASAMPAAAQGGNCMSDIAIQQAVASGQILSLNELLARAGLQGSKILPPVEVCNLGGELFYRLSILDASGNASSRDLHALTGQQ